jgi:hypothetical protein
MATDWSNVDPTEDHWPNGLDLATADVPELMAFVVHKNHVYDLDKVRDGNLWDMYRTDFEGWTADTFMKVNQAQRTNLRFTLRQHGVLVDRKTRLDKALSDTL